MHSNGLALFNKVVETIAWTNDYPKKGIRFADLSETFGSTELALLAKKATDCLCIEKGQIIVGVPTRGCTWATILANASFSQAIFLSKDGVGTRLPNCQPLCGSETVYAEKVTKFSIRTVDVRTALEADIVWIADDVVESGQTMAAVQAAFQELGCKDVRCITLMTIDRPTLATPRQLSTVIQYISTTQLCHPGNVFTVDSLFTLRGVSEKKGQVVFGPPSMNALVKQCARYNDARVGSISWESFPGGGMPNVSFPHEIWNAIFIYDASWMSTIQDGIVHAIARNCTGRVEVIVPYLPQGTMERVDQEGVMASAQTTLHSLCASMPQTGEALVGVTIVDIHQTGSRFYCTDRVQYTPKSVLKQLVPGNANDTIIAFPDDGACKRFKHLFPTHTMLIFSKTRQGEERKIHLAERIGRLDVSKANQVIIVDDLTRTGGTILNTAKVLRSEMGAQRIGACFVHADFDAGKTISFATSNLLNDIYCSNSVPAKARALFMACPAKVHVNDIFSGQRLLFQDSRPDADIIASDSPLKIAAVQSRFRGASCFYSGPVPSGIAEQPVGVEQIQQGLKNRLQFVSSTFPSQDTQVVAFESGIVLMDGHYVDRAMAGRANGGRITTGHFCDDPIDITEQDIAAALEQGITVGELMQRRYNLPTKSSWIPNRAEQLYKSLK